MITTFKNYTVGTKILIGYAIALFLMSAVNVIAILRLQEINATVVTLADGLASEQHFADQVVANVWATQFYALQYLDQQNPLDLNRYRTEYARFETLLADAEQQITKPTRLHYIDGIQDGIQTYGADFSSSVNLLMTRNQILLVDLDQQGRLAEIKLEQIRANSFFGDDTETSYQAGNAQRALLLMRVAAFQYLESGDPYWVDEFDRWHESAQTSFQKLGDGLDSQLYRELAADAEQAVGTYAGSFAIIQDNYRQQQTIVSDLLTVTGPAIRDAGAAISTDVTAEFQEAAVSTQRLVSRTQWILLIILGIAIVMTLGSGLFIARNITRPLEKVTAAARQIAELDLRKLTSEMGAIAQGDLTRDLTITTRAFSFQTNDEIGQMARAFNALIRQLQKAGAAFSEMAANLRKVTEHNRKLVQDAETARQKAEAANQAKSDFLASMSHELRTPLNAVLGFAQILKRDSQLSRPQQDAVGVIHESGQHLLALINDILDLAKIEAGKSTLEPSYVHLPTFLGSIVRMMRLQAEEKGLSFDYHLADQIPETVEVDEKRLRQVLINLLGNSIKFTPEGGISFQVSAPGREQPAAAAQAGRSALNVRFSVTDTGLGIESEFLGIIFQPFEQLKNNPPAAEGVGLGLAISKQLVQTMGGEIQVQSEAGQGSTFWFDLHLPIVEGEPIPTSREIVAPLGYTGGRRRLLLVDDVANNLQLISRFLEPLGFEVRMAQNGQEALEEAVRFRPDMIIMDMLMPGQAGRETIREIRQLASLEHTVIVATSADYNQIDPEAAGGGLFLTKPIDFNRLLALLEEQLGLTWTYESPPALPGAAASEGGATGLPFRPPAQAELLEIYDLAMKGNMPGIYKRAVRLEQHGDDYLAFSRQLQRLAKRFDEEKLLALLRSLLEGSEISQSLKLQSE